MTKIRVAVIGAGHLGKIHAKLLLENPKFELVAVCDPYASARQTVESLLNVATIADYHTLPGKVEAVVIAAPTSLHYSIASWTLRHKLHSFVEKPLTPTAAEAETLNELAERVGCVLQVGHVERFNPAWSTVRPWIRQPRFIEAIRESNYSGRSTDVGVVLDLMIHDLDLVLNIANSDVVRVEATGHALLGQHEDIAEARLEFADGCVANVKASRVARQATRKMQVFGDSGMVEVDFGTASAELVEFSQEVQSRRFQADMLPLEERLKVKDQLFTQWMPHRSLSVKPGNAIAAEHNDFARTIVEAGQPEVTGEQAHRVLMVAESVLHSLRNKLQSRPTSPVYEAFPIRRAA